MAKYRTCKGAFDFAADMEMAAKVLGIESARDTAVTLALQLDRLIVQGTPKDTGRAQCSWNLTEGKIDRSVHPEIPKGQHVEPTPHTGAGLKGESIIYLTNSLPYIVPLEYGHSGQAPTGMVRKAIAEVMAAI